MGTLNKPIVAWSHSALATYESCPKKYYHLKVLKDFKESFDNPAALEGKANHKHFEDRMVKGAKLPMELMHHEKYLAQILAAPGDQYGEQRLALNGQFEPTGFFDRDCYGRAIIDYMKVNGENAIIIDWKFGKMKDDFAQLKLFAAFASVFMPEVNNFTCLFYWAKEKQFTKEKYHRDDLPQLWNEILPRVHSLEAAIKTTDFPAKTSGLCKRYCPITSCPHCG